MIRVHTHTHTHTHYKIVGKDNYEKFVKNVKRKKQENLVKGSKFL